MFAAMHPPPAAGARGRGQYFACRQIRAARRAVTGEPRSTG